jgi:hypothetical protein
MINTRGAHSTSMRFKFLPGRIFRSRHEQFDISINDEVFMSKRSLARAIQIQSLHRVLTQWIVSRMRYMKCTPANAV